MLDKLRFLLTDFS